MPIISGPMGYLLPMHGLFGRNGSDTSLRTSMARTHTLENKEKFEI